MSSKTFVPHSVTTMHELGEHAAVLVLGTETQANLILGLNGAMAMLSLLHPDNKDLLSPLMRGNLHGGCAVLVEHLRSIAHGAGFDAYRLEPDSASELLELAEKLARGEAVF